MECRGIESEFFNVVYSVDFLERVKEIFSSLEKNGSAEDCVRFCILVNAILKFDIYEQLRQIKCPVLVLGDKNDQTIGIESSYEIIEKLGCQYVLEAF